MTGDVPEVTGQNTSTFSKTGQIMFFHNLFISLCLNSSEKKTVNYAFNLHHILGLLGCFHIYYEIEIK